MKEILEEFCWDSVSDMTAVGRLQKMLMIYFGPWHGTSKWSQCNSEVNFKNGCLEDRLSACNGLQLPMLPEEKKNLLQSPFLL